MAVVLGAVVELQRPHPGHRQANLGPLEASVRRHANLI